MTPRLVQYDAPGWGVGEAWLDDGVVVHAELPRPGRGRQEHHPDPESEILAGRLSAFFSGAADDFRDVRLRVPAGFHGECVRALRGIPRGELVTYGELAALAGRPGAARAAGTACARCALSPFVPTHRVVAATGIGAYGDLGSGYKRRLLALEGVSL